MSRWPAWLRRWRSFSVSSRQAAMKRALVRSPLPFPLGRIPHSWAWVLHRWARWPSRPLPQRPSRTLRRMDLPLGLRLDYPATEAILRGEFISFSLLLADLAAGSPAFSAHLEVALDRDMADNTFSLAQDRDSGSFNLIRTSLPNRGSRISIRGCKRGLPRRS